MCIGVLGRWKNSYQMSVNAYVLGVVLMEPYIASNLFIEHPSIYLLHVLIIPSYKSVPFSSDSLFL